MNGHTRLLRKHSPAIYARMQNKGWSLAGFTGKGHLRIEHDATGRKLTVACSPGDHRGQLNAISYMKRIDHADR